MSSITLPSSVGFGHRTPPGEPKMFSFFTASTVGGSDFEVLRPAGVTRCTDGVQKRRFLSVC